MFLTEFSIRRPVAMSCLLIGLTLLGINAYFNLNVELLPSVDIPIVTIRTIYPGASPIEIETEVARRIEDAVGQIDGLKHLNNACMENVCITILEFNLGVDVDIAATDVREKLDLILNKLPKEVESPQVLKFDINAVPVIDLALTGKVPLSTLYDFADNELKDRLSVIPGVAEVRRIGGAKLEVHTLLDRNKLAAYNLSTFDVINAIKNEVRTIPAGHIQDHGSEFSVRYNADFNTIQQLGELEIKNQKGARCYLRDLGSIQMGTDEIRQAAFLDGNPAIAIRIVKKAEANAVDVTHRIRDILTDIQKQLPGDMHLTWVSDNGHFIQATVNSTFANVWEGVLLTAIILFLFLHNLRSTFIVAVTMPISILISLVFIQWLHYSLNLSTLLALGLSVGVLVTNSIVILENIVKRLQETGNPRQAARIGAEEVAIAVLASAGTNVVVLFPIAIMGGKVGLFFRPFAVTMMIVTLVSLFISFTLTPILCSILLRKETRKQGGIIHYLEQQWDAFFDYMAQAYSHTIRNLSRHRTISTAVLLVAILLFMSAIMLLPKVGFSFFKEADRGKIFVRLEFPTTYSLNETIQRTRNIEQKLLKIPTCLHTYTTVGKVDGILGQVSEGVYLSQILCIFPDKIYRPFTSDQLLAQIRKQLADETDCIASVSIPAIMGGQANPIELEIHGKDLTILDNLANKACEISHSLEGFVDPDTSVRPGKPELEIKPNRPVLADLHYPALWLGTIIRANLAGIKAGTFKKGDRSYDIRVKLKPEAGKDQVKNFRAPGITGQAITLNSVADIQETRMPIQILRVDKERVTKLFSQLIGNYPLGKAVKALSHALNTQASFPAGYSYRYAGTYEVMAEANAEFLKAGIMAILLTYLTLAALLESFRQPFIILVTIPLALIGVLWALFINGESISMFVLLGFVMLIGIVVNNAILIMDEVNQEVADNTTPHKAMEDAINHKFRPIIMITLAAILGMLPLALSHGLGSEFRNDIGSASVGGIFVSALLTLLIIPILYDLFTKE